MSPAGIPSSNRMTPKPLDMRVNTTITIEKQIEKESEDSESRQK